jgi:deoxyadenosine/deoxycytidine kinase
VPTAGSIATQTGPLIGVCGPIGSGKSTVVPALATALGLCARPERYAANPFFERFVADRATWAFLSQAAFIVGAIDDASIARDSGGGVLERPAQEMLEVFVRDLADVGLLARDEMATLEQIVALSARRVAPPDLLVVLHADPQVLLARLRQRGHTGDDSYDRDDMDRLQRAYDRWRATLAEHRVIDVDIDAVDLRAPAAIARLAADARAALATLPRRN